MTKNDTERVELPCTRCGQPVAVVTRPQLPADLVDMVRPMLGLLKLKAGAEGAGFNPAGLISGDAKEIAETLELAHVGPCPGAP